MTIGFIDTYRRSLGPTTPTFVGQVEWWDAGQYLFTESCGINRVLESDALLDAHKLYEDRMEQNLIRR